MPVRAALLFSMIVMLSACGSSLTPEQQKYLQTAKDHPTQFIMLRSEERDAWGRAILWIRSYSNMNIVTANDTLVATEAPGKGRDWELSYGYTVEKKQKGDRVQITVLCGVNNPFNVGDANENAHLLAYYIATGNPNPPELIHK